MIFLMLILMLSSPLYAGINFADFGMVANPKNIEVPMFSSEGEAIKWANEQVVSRELRNALLKRVNWNVAKVNEMSYDHLKYTASDMRFSTGNLLYAWIALRIVQNKIGDMAMNGASVYCGSMPWPATQEE